MGKYCFGIDVGGTSVKCGLFQTDGILMEKWEIPTRKENNGEAILPDIAKTILDKIEERKLDKAEMVWELAFRDRSMIKGRFCVQ